MRRFRRYPWFGRGDRTEYLEKRAAENGRILFWGVLGFALVIAVATAVSKLELF